MMKKQIHFAVAAAAIVGGLALSPAGSASAAHCAKNNSPGFSYFGQVGRMTVDNTGGPGANECPANTGSPSDRAPGQNGR